MTNRKGKKRRNYCENNKSKKLKIKLSTKQIKKAKQKVLNRKRAKNRFLVSKEPRTMEIKASLRSGFDKQKPSHRNRISKRSKKTTKL